MQLKTFWAGQWCKYCIAVPLPTAIVLANLWENLTHLVSWHLGHSGQFCRVRQSIRDTTRVNSVANLKTKIILCPNSQEWFFSVNNVEIEATILEHILPDKDKTLCVRV